MRGQFRGRRGGFRGRFRGRGGFQGGQGGFHAPSPAQIQRDRERSERSVIVRGFDTETNVADLTTFFSKYGALENVTLNMEKDKGIQALVVFEGKEAVQQVMEEPSLTMNNSSITVVEKKSKYDLYQETRKLATDIVKHPDTCVWIKGIPKAQPETEIKEFFSQFGTVQGILMRNDFRKGDHFHYVQFDNKDDAQKVIAMETLDFNGETLTLDHKKTKEEITEARKEEAKHSIYVQGFDEDTTEDQIMSVFQSAGQIEKVFLGKQGAYAFVEFSSPEAVDAAISLENLSIGEKLLIVKKRETTKKFQLPREKLLGPQKPAIDHMAILRSLLEQNTVEEQMAYLQTELEITAEDTTKRDKATSDMLQIFADYFPGCNVEQFGSSVNGFGVKGTDLDVFLDLNLDGPVSNLEGYPKKPLPYVADLPTITVEGGMITREGLKETNMGDRCRLINRILHASGDHLFSEFLLIRNARCPVIRMVHTETELRVDLSINNRLALHNTRLIRMYADYDPRIKPLYFSLRHWAKYKDIVGNPLTGPKLTNYALSMMLFHYLSVCSPPVLPTVEQLASLADTKTMIDDWDCTLVTDKSKAPFPLNNQGVVDLMAGFFHYFANFSWSGKVLKTRSSQLVDRTAFQAEVDAEIEAAKQAAKEAGDANSKIDMRKFPKVSAMTIMDPFVTTHNIAHNINNRFRFQIKYEFEQAAAKMQHDRFLKQTAEAEASKKQEAAAASAVAAGAGAAGSPPAPGGDTSIMDWGLAFLFSRDRLRVQSLDDAAQLNELGINLFHVAPYHLPISMKISQLPQNLLQPGPEREAFKDTWTSEILNFIQKILMELMLVECADASVVLNQQVSLLDGKDGVSAAAVNTNGKREADDVTQSGAEIESKRLKLESVNPQSIVLALKCATRHRMWQNRKQLKKEMRVQMPEADEFTLEHNVTQKLMAAQPALLDSVLEFYLTFSKEQTHGFNILRMSMYPTIGAKEFTCFFAFLSSFVAKIVDKCFIIKG